VLLARHYLVCTPPRRNIYDVRKVSSVNQALIDLVEGVSIWGVPGLEVNLFEHEVRTFDRHLPTCGKVEQAVFAYRWLMYVSRPAFAFLSPITNFTS
jgi:hypothetical protein